MEQGLSVRQVENIVKITKKPTSKKALSISSALLHQLKAIESNISASLGTKVKISHGAKKGKIEIEYYGNDDLERLIKLINL